MNDKVLYWAAVVFSSLALVLLIVNVTLINNNRGLQQDVNERQVKINAGNNLSQLNQSLAQALADAAVKNDDKDIRKLLAEQGITINKPAATTADEGKSK